jgi:xanthine/uracil permease
VVLYVMIGLRWAKIGKENGVDFGNPINLVPVAAGIIIAIGDTTLVITDNFQISGIAFGTIVTVVAFHLVRLIAPPYLQEELRRERDGRPGEGGKGAEGAAIIIDEPGAYKEP